MEVLRNLALSLERLGAHEAASGVVRGAADGLRKEMPGLDGQLRTLGRLAREAAEREQVDPEALEREWQNGGLPLHSFGERLNRLLDEVVESAHSRTDEIRTAEERARALAGGMTEPVLERLQGAAPTLREEPRELGPIGAELAEQLVRGLVGGIQPKLQQQPEVLGGVLEHAGRQRVRGLAAGLREELAAHPVGEAVANGTLRRASRELTGGVLEALGASLRRPLLAAAGMGSALLALTLLSGRWRRA